MFVEAFGGAQRSRAPRLPAGAAESPGPSRRRRRWRRHVLLGFAALFLLLFAWIAATTPLSRSLQPPVASSLVLLSAEGRPIARQGAIVDDPVSVERLPEHVWRPVLAIEDRRFARHPGIDLSGLVRAALRNLLAGEVREGGSTITQQLVKHTLLSSDRSVARKLREILVAFWLELRLSKAEILSRYLSTAYYGDNVYGLRAAARHYFDRPPERLTVAQAAMLAGLLKAPSRLNPVADLAAAQARTRLVLAAMADVGMLDEVDAARFEPPVPVRVAAREVPSGTYFADWVFPAADLAVGPRSSRSVRTTLEDELQRLAVRIVGRHELRGAQVALVAMRPDGSVAAMVGGRSYRQSPFNRATQARRQPGSTFKLFVYLAALRNGFTPDSPIEDAPVTVGDWSPVNADGRYRGWIDLRTAFGESSNVAAVRLARQVGTDEVVEAARDLGVRSPLDPAPSLALGTSAVSLLELTSAYTAILAGRYPVQPTGLPPELRGAAGAGAAAVPPQRLDRRSTWPMMLDLLWASANLGTGRAAALDDVPTFGKTGTSQDNRDAWFVGFAGDLVVGIWIGHDDNRPLRGVSGGGLPAAIWRDFMAGALREGAVRVGADSPFDIPRFRYVPSAVADPRPVVREQAPPPQTRERRGMEERWQRWLRRSGDRDRARDWERERDRDERDWERERERRERYREEQWEELQEWLRQRERRRERRDEAATS